nr:LacI family DNA-binding transcriptional regulator [Shuttleworthia satelles]
MASMKDVARSAQVSIATVSRYLNGSGYVSEDARSKIKKAVEELSYKPNELARSFYHNQSHIIGVVIPDMEYPFFSKVSKYIEMQLYERGYKTMICNTIGINNREKDYLDLLNRNIVDGLIVGSHSLNEEVYQKVKKPILAIDRDLGENIPLVSSDHKKGGRLAAELMIHAGCRNVIQFSIYQMVNTPARERHKEFARVCELHGVHVTTVETAWNEFDYDYYQRIARKYLYSGCRYDGVFSVDLSVACCMRVLKEQGKHIPKDVCLVGYDGVEIGEFTDPQMTSIAQDVPAIAAACAQGIIAKIEGTGGGLRHQVIDVSVRQGNTVR